MPRYYFTTADTANPVIWTAEKLADSGHSPANNGSGFNVSTPAATTNHQACSFISSSAPFSTATWPTTGYSVSWEIISTGADITYSFGNVRSRSDGGVERGAFLGLSSGSGTGIKTYSPTLTGINGHVDIASTDRLTAHIRTTNGNMMDAQTIGIGYTDSDAWLETPGQAIPVGQVVEINGRRVTEEQSASPYLEMLVGDSASIPGEARRLAQAFVSTVPFVCESAIVRLSNGNTAPTGTLTVEVVDSLTSTTPLASATLAESSLTPSAIDYTFTFTPVRLEPGTTYYLRLRRSVTSNTNYVLVGWNDASYSSGSEWLLGFTGAWGESAGADLRFRISGPESVVTPVQTYGQQVPVTQVAQPNTAQFQTRNKRKTLGQARR